MSCVSVECLKFIPSARCLLFFWFIANRQRLQLLKSWAAPCPQCTASRQLVDMNDQAIRVAPCPALHRSMIILLCAGLVLTTSAHVHNASIFNSWLETGWRLVNGSVGRDHQAAQAGQSFCSAYSISKPDVTFAQQTSASQNAVGTCGRQGCTWGNETQYPGEAVFMLSWRRVLHRSMAKHGRQCEAVWDGLTHSGLHKGSQAKFPKNMKWPVTVSGK